MEVDKEITVHGIASGSGFEHTDAAFTDSAVTDVVVTDTAVTDVAVTESCAPKSAVRNKNDYSANESATVHRKADRVTCSMSQCSDGGGGLFEGAAPMVEPNIVLAHLLNLVQTP